MQTTKFVVFALLVCFFFVATALAQNANRPGQTADSDFGAFHTCELLLVYFEVLITFFSPASQSSPRTTSTAARTR